MFVGETLWAIIGIGVILLGVVMAYGSMRSRRRSAQLDRASEETTRRIYREEQN